MELIAAPFGENDIDELITWFPTAADVVQWAGPRLRAPLDLKQLLPFLIQEPGGWQAWTVRGGTGHIAGHFQLLFDPVCRQATLGRVAIAPAQRGRGLAAPMVELALQCAFAEPAIHRVELRVFDFNKAAIATYAGLRFQHEGLCREAVPVGDVFWNVAIMGLLRRDWPGDTQ